MKKLAVIVGCAFLVVILASIGNMIVSAQASNTGLQPSVTVWPPVVKLHANTSLVILGSGFEPNQELYILLPAADGTTSNIVDDFLKPKPTLGSGLKADELGNFASLFTIGGLDRVQTEGVYHLSITDLNYKTLTTTPIGFADPDGRSRAGLYPEGKPDYQKNPTDPRPLPWTAPFFEYPSRP